MAPSEDNRSATLLFSGDAMLGRGVNRAIRQDGPTDPLDSIVDVTRAADLFFTNLECAISPQNRRFSGEEKAFYFRADPPAVETLTHAGVDAVSLANNHALDADYAGLRDTLRILADHHIASAGAGVNQDAAHQPSILETNNLMLGLLSFCDHQADFAATADRPGIWHMDLTDEKTEALLCHQVERLSHQVDHVIVAAHWQPNWVPEVPSPYRELAKHLMDAGTTIVWGHGPHHFQGVEFDKGRAVFYSTGGLVDDYAVNNYYRNDRQLLFEVTLTAEGIQNIRALPIELDFARTRPAKDPARAWIVRRFQEVCENVGSRIDDQRSWLIVRPADAHPRQ